MYAGRVRSEHIGTTITLKGWVSRRRNLGGLIFIDLRDREGLMQLVVNPENTDAAVVETAESLRSEFVIEVTGTHNKINGLLAMLDGFNIVEIVRTGLAGISRGLNNFEINKKENRG